MPILTPDYLAKHLFEIVKKVCDRFDFHIYNEMFEDVLPFKMDIVLKVFDMVKNAYVSKKSDIIIGLSHAFKGKIIWNHALSR